MLKLSKFTIPHMSLRLNLMVVCEAVVLLFLSLAVMLYFSRQALIDEAKHDAEETLEGTVQHIDNVLMSVEQSVYIIYQELQGHLDQPERMFAYSRKIVESNPYIEGCAVAFKPNYYPGRELFMAYVHRNGSDLNDSTLIFAEAFGSTPYTKQVWYTAPMTSGRACWTDPLAEEEDEGVTLSFCLPIYDKNECVGAVVADLPISLLSQIIHEAMPLPHSYSVLLSRNGTYIVHPDAEKLSKQKTVFAIAEQGLDPSVRDAAKAMTSGETGYKPFRLNHEDWYVFYKPFQRAKEFQLPAEKLGWSVGMVYLEDDILGDYNHLMYLVLAITIIGVLLFFILSRMLINRQISPLRQLTQSAQQIANGQYDKIIPDPQREDEIGQLEKHFQKMQMSLSGKSSELERLTAQLTKRSEDLRKAYGQAQGSDRMKTTFLHYMTTQMVLPSDLIERSVTKLCNNYHQISPQEAEYEVGVIKEQSGIVLDLLDHMVDALMIEAEESEKLINSEKEVDHE